MFHDFDACKHNTAAGHCLPLPLLRPEQPKPMSHAIARAFALALAYECARGLRASVARLRIAYCGELWRELEVQDAHVHHAAPVFASPAEPAGDARACHHSAGNTVLGCDWLRRDATCHATRNTNTTWRLTLSAWDAMSRAKRHGGGDAREGTVTRSGAVGSAHAHMCRAHTPIRARTHARTHAQRDAVEPMLWLTFGGLPTEVVLEARGSHRDEDRE